MLALRRLHPSARVHVWARRSQALEALARAGIADLLTTDAAEAAKNATLVLLATPVESMAPIAAQIAAHLSPECIVTDVGSVKGSVVESVEAALGSARSSFLGSHPMAGSEKAGFEAARGDLFNGATCVVTPTGGTCESHLTRIVHFWTSLGCKVLTMSPQEHDRKIARISHLPHAVAAAVVRAALQADPSAAECTGNGFRDATRIAAGDPALWTGILLQNRTEVLAALNDARREMAELVEILSRMDEEALRRYLADAQSLRIQVPAVSPTPYGPDQSP